MKNKIYILGIIASILLGGCENILEREVVFLMTAEQVNETYNNTQYRANAIYNYLPEGFLYVDGAMMASASDEAEHTLETSAIQKFNTGSWNELSNPDDAWIINFKGIRAANLFLANSDKVKFEYLRLDPNPASQAVYQERMNNIEKWKYEARFLRAFFYSELVKRYGGVPIISEPIDLDSDYKILERNTLTECIQFISDECDSAASVLPSKQVDADLGRVTKGAALALKSRILLYAASDLFNTPLWAAGYGNPELISLTGNRASKWQEAADAAKALIDLTSGGYSLNANYVNLFKSFSSNEIILAQRNSPSNTFEKASYPIGYDLGKSGTTPSQNLVDDYEMADGSAFDWTNPVHAANPYENRDPRLKFSILTNNTYFKGRPVECWTGGLDGSGKARATRTGYYLNKYVDPDLDLLQNRTSVHSWIVIRLAEVYLNYAEALNEYDPGNPDIKAYVDLVRKRPGVNMPGLPDGLSQSEMREKIHHERRIELAFEGHRLWDVRRWMIAESTLDVPLKGVDITKNGDDSFAFVVVSVENRVFEPKMYFYPIPQTEINITGWVQNPLW